jgi:L-lactate dehydrogenase complex protein LldG
MLARIREHLAASAPFDRVHQEGLAQHLAEPSGRAIEHSPEISLVDLFREALEAVNGICTIVADEAEAASILKQVIELNQLRRIAVSDSPMVDRLTRRLGGNLELLSDAQPEALFDCDAGISSAQWAIAETGTLVLESKNERHRLVSLVPPVHIAIVEAGRILRTMSEVLEAVSTASELSRTVTFITGPSRTSDIELTLAIGVHGPAKLHVIVIDHVKQTDAGQPQSG